MLLFDILLTCFATSHYTTYPFLLLHGDVSVNPLLLTAHLNLFCNISGEFFSPISELCQFFQLQCSSCVYFVTIGEKAGNSTKVS